MIPIVLIHSAGGNSHSFDAVRLHLAGLDVRVPAFPGREETPGDHPGTIARAAEWLACWLAEEAIPRAVIGGHSVGGAVAIELALSTPSVVAGLILVSTGARLRVHPEILATLTAAAARGVEADLSRWLLPDPARALTSPATALADWRMADGFDRLDSIDAIAAPTRILSGDADTLTPPKYAAWLRDHIRGSTLVSLPGAHHDLPVERPREVADAIRSFAAAL